MEINKIPLKEKRCKSTYLAAFCRRNEIRCKESMVLIRVFPELNVKKAKNKKTWVKAKRTFYEVTLKKKDFKTVNRKKFNNEICQEWKSTSYHFTTETSTHLFCHCPSSIAFWKYFEASWSVVRDQHWNSPNFRRYHSGRHNKTIPLTKPGP